MKIKIKSEKRYRRHKRIRARISGTASRPRLCVFRSAKYIYAQLIDDEKGCTLVAASSWGIKRTCENIKQSRNEKIKTEKKIKTNKKDIAYEVGKIITEKAKALKIEKVVFDRGGYKYHGRVRAIAEGARDGGLRF